MYLLPKSILAALFSVAFLAGGHWMIEAWGMQENVLMLMAGAYVLWIIAWAIPLLRWPCIALPAGFAVYLAYVDTSIEPSTLLGGLIASASILVALIIARVLFPDRRTEA